MKKVWFRMISVTGAVLFSAAMLSVASAEDKAVPMDAFGDLELGIPEDAAAENSEDSTNLDDVLELPPITEDVVLPVPGTSVTEAVIAQNPAPAASADAPADAPAVQEEKVLAAPALDAPAAPAPEPEAVPVLAIPAETAAAPDEEAAAPAEPVPAAVPAVLPKSGKPASIVEGPLPAMTQNAVPAMPVPQQAQEFAPGSYEGVPQGMVPGRVNGNCRSCQGNGPAYVVNPGPGRRAIIYGTQPNGVHAYPRRECPNCGRGRGPMQDPYYSVRGPRDFLDPNPRSIGP